MKRMRRNHGGAEGDGRLIRQVPEIGKNAKAFFGGQDESGAAAGGGQRGFALFVDTSDCRRGANGRGRGFYDRAAVLPIRVCADAGRQLEFAP
jgi:hypothetical protein